MKNNLMFWTWWAWEPIYFYRRSGSVPGVADISRQNLDKWYESIHAEKTVKAMRDLGINCAVTHFYKGFGLEFEKAEMQRTRELVKLCHKYGIKVFGYVQYGSIFHEQLFKEIPEAVNWIQLDKHGKPLLWWSAEYRYLPCINHPDYIKYLKKCIDYGIKETGLDGLHFDNFYSRPCYCESCRQKFKTYLRTGYAGKLKALGIDSVDDTDIPDEQLLQNPLCDQPLVRIWVEFRKETMNAFMREIYGYARSQKKDLMLLSNPSTIRGTLDQGALRSTDIYQIGTQAEFLWAEGGDFPSVRQGHLIHQVNFFKTAEAFGYRVFSTTWKHEVEGSGLAAQIEDVALNTAESTAFGAEPGSNWLLRPTASGKLMADSRNDLVAELRKYLKFIKANSKLFAGSRAVPEVAVYLSAEARGMNYRRTYGGFLTAQQILLENNIQFDLLFSEQSEKIKNYSCIVIADAENLAKKEIKDLKAYVNSGGKILLAGRAEKCLLDMDAAAVKHIELAEDWTEYVDSGYTSRISLPPEAGKFLTALKEIAGDKQAFEINAPGYVVSEVRKTKNGTLLLHLVNYKNTDMAKGVKVRVNPAWIPEKRRCELLNPDHKTKELTGTLGNETLNYNIPPFKTYCILKFSEDCHA